MRPTHKNRNRNRHRSGGGSGGGGGGGGGNPLSRVYESNGPDVKVRGTAQTVADKYLQLGRDAQSSGDIVMAESYFQHAEHYLRIVSAAQAYNQQSQQQYRRPEDEFDDEDLEDHPENAAQSAGEPEGLGDQPAIEAGPERFQQQPNQGQRQPRDNRDNREPQNRDQQGRDQQGRDQGGRDRFRPRWQDRRNDNQPGQQAGQGGEARAQPQPPRNDEQPRTEAVAAPETDRWEAPSFLRRPTPTPAPAPAPVVAAAEDVPAASTPAPKRKYERRPRKDAAAEPASAGEDVKAPAGD
ncbi:DUF4167 domain-containing protein [Aestuariivirga sp.]|uniref:DUF4167 domain-containing protein n=1 Tax=Aestuariivirga sp. TaxID=2650926 RepID=UPI003784104C